MKGFDTAHVPKLSYVKLLQTKSHYNHITQFKCFERTCIEVFLHYWLVKTSVQTEHLKNFLHAVYSCLRTCSWALSQYSHHRQHRSSSSGQYLPFRFPERLIVSNTHPTNFYLVYYIKKCGTTQVLTVVHPSVKGAFLLISHSQLSQML